MSAERLRSLGGSNDNKGGKDDNKGGKDDNKGGKYDNKGGKDDHDDHHGGNDDHDDHHGGHGGHGGNNGDKCEAGMNTCLCKAFCPCSGPAPAPVPCPEPVVCPEPTPTPNPTPNTDIYLKSAANFAVLSATTVTSAASTSVVGSVGVSPGTAITGVIILSNGSLEPGTPVAAAAQTDLQAAYNDLVALPLGAVMAGEIGGLTLTPGIYKFATSCNIGSDLILDGQGNPNAFWVFQIGSTLITAMNVSVKMINQGNPFNVYWQVGSSATISASNNMKGNIIAYTSITLGAAAFLRGRALALGGAVTLIADNITIQ